MSSTSETETELQERVRQQEVVAELGQRALEADDLDALLREATVAVAETLDTEYAKVLESLPGGDAVVLRAGVGWRDGLVGSATVPTDRDSQAGYTLLTEEPVIVDDLETEPRFSGPELLTSHDVTSGISVIIGSIGEPWGVLGTHTTERREFTEHDANFVRSVANVIASAIENHRTRRSLREEKEQFRKLVDEVEDYAIFRLDPNGRIQSWNRGAEAIKGYEAEEIVGEHFSTFYPDDAVEEGLPERLLGEAVREGRTTHEGWRVRQDGTRFWASVSITALRDDGGELRGFTKVTRDLTDRRKRERRLEESERQYRTLAECFPNGIVTLYDEDLEYLLAAGQAFEELPVDPADVEANHVREVWDEDVTEALVPVLRTALEGDEDAVEVEYLGRDWIVHAVPVTDGRGTVFAGMTMAQDITERKRYERRLEESERRYRTLVENFPKGAVGLFDDELRYTAVGGQLLSELGISPDERIGGHITDLYPDELVEQVEPHFRAALEGERTEFEVEYRDRELYAYALPVRDADDEVFAGMLVVQDVTERKEYQRRLEESNERLEQFAYAASHDLQEPLRMISSYLSLIERRYADELDADGEEFLAYAVDGAERMREMIDGLLEYSRVDTQGDPLEPIDLNAVVEAALENLEVRIEETDAQITVADLPEVRGDESQLRQVFQNLLGNAVEYADDEPPRIRVAADRRGERWAVSVHDEGIGIDPADSERIFEVFQRLHTHEEHAGTGIGLALCQRIVERHGGEIWVESGSDDGATFTFTLPAVTDGSRS